MTFRIFLVALFCLLLPSLAYAASGVDDFGGLFNDAYAAVQGGDWAIAVVSGLVLVVGLTRRYGGVYFGWLAHKLVAPLLVVAGAFGFSLLVSLQLGADFSARLAYGALKTSLMAAGGYAMLKLYLEALEQRAPGWMQPLFSIFRLIYAARREARIPQAIKAGSAAVAAKPSEGFDVDVKKLD